MGMKKRFLMILLSGLLAVSTVFGSAAAAKEGAAEEFFLTPESTGSGSGMESEILMEEEANPEEKNKTEESVPTEKENKPEENAPDEEESEPEESTPDEEESEPEASAPVKEESESEESAPDEEESEPEESASDEEESEPEESASDEEESESEESAPDEEENDLESIPSAEDSLTQESVPETESGEQKPKTKVIGFQDFDLYGSEPYMTLTYDSWDRQLPEFPEKVTLIMDDESIREIKAVWTTEDDFSDVEVEHYVYTLELPKNIQLDEEIARDLEENLASLPWIELIPDEGVAAYAVGKPDLNDFSFPISDIRDSSKEMIFDGGNGKVTMLIFGGISSCGNTGSTIRAAQSAQKMVGKENLDIFAFDIKDNSDSTIISWLTSAKISEDICVNSVNASADYYTLFRYCWTNTLESSQLAMPLVVYKNAEGEIEEYTTGNKDVINILEALEACGLEAEAGSGDYTVTVRGQSLYSEAFEVLALVNRRRAENNLSALTMDKQLLDAAMTRAAECAVYYSHTRPTGLSCFSIIGTMHAENIAAGQYDASSVMTDWMNSTGHRTNILASCHESIGIGCFRYNNRNYWVQVFGDGVAESISQPSDQTRTYHVETASDYVQVGFGSDQKEINVGDTLQLQVYAESDTNHIAISASAYRWSSKNTAVARVDSQGKVTAVAKGITTIVAAHQMNSDETLEIRIIVDENPGPTMNKIANTVSGVHVYWNGQSGASRYYLYRSTSRNGVYSKVAETTATHYTDTAVSSGVTYYYKVSSLKSGKETGKSEAIGIAFVATPDLTLRVNRSVGIGLGWNKVKGATGYAIYRKTTGSWVRVATIAGNSTLTWNDTAVRSNNGTVYHYTIRALAGSNMKTLSGCRSTGRTMVRLFTPTISSAVKSSATSLKATWNRNSAATGYEVRLMVGSTVYKTYTYGNNTIIAKTITGLPKGRTYKVQVRSYKKVTGVGSFYSAWSAAKNVTL